MTGTNDRDGLGNQARNSKSSTARRERPGLSFRFAATLEVATLIATLAASGLIVRELWRKPSSSADARSTLKVPVTPLFLEGAPIKGSTAARAIMVIYSDFQCPFCGSFTRETLPRIEREYVETGLLTRIPQRPA